MQQRVASSKQPVFEAVAALLGGTVAKQCLLLMDDEQCVASSKHLIGQAGPALFEATVSKQCVHMMDVEQLLLKIDDAQMLTEGSRVWGALKQLWFKVDIALLLEVDGLLQLEVDRALQLDVDGLLQLEVDGLLQLLQSFRDGQKDADMAIGGFCIM